MKMRIVWVMMQILGRLLKIERSLIVEKLNLMKPMMMQNTLIMKHHIKITMIGKKIIRFIIVNCLISLIYIIKSTKR